MTNREICQDLLFLLGDATNIESRYGEWNAEIYCVLQSIRKAILAFVPDELPGEKKKGGKK